MGVLYGGMSAVDQPGVWCVLNLRTQADSFACKHAQLKAHVRDDGVLTYRGVSYKDVALCPTPCGVY